MVAQSAQRLVSLGPLHNEYEKVIYVGLCQNKCTILTIYNSPYQSLLTTLTLSGHHQVSFSPRQ